MCPPEVVLSACPSTSYNRPTPNSQSAKRTITSFPSPRPDKYNMFSINQMQKISNYTRVGIVYTCNITMRHHQSPSSIFTTTSSPLSSPPSPHARAMLAHNASPTTTTSAAPHTTPILIPATVPRPRPAATASSIARRNSGIGQNPTGASVLDRASCCCDCTLRKSDSDASNTATREPVSTRKSSACLVALGAPPPVLPRGPNMTRHQPAVFGTARAGMRARTSSTGTVSRRTETSAGRASARRPWRRSAWKNGSASACGFGRWLWASTWDGRRLKWRLYEPPVRSWSLQEIESV